MLDSRLRHGPLSVVRPGEIRFAVTGVNFTGQMVCCKNNVLPDMVTRMMLDRGMLAGRSRAVCCQWPVVRGTLARF